MHRFRALLASALLALCALLAGPQAAWAAPDFPKLTGQVVDAANLIPDTEEAALTQNLATLEQQSQRQLVVVTLPDLQGYDIADYGYQLGRHWALGDKQRNDGAILIVAKKERKVRIEVGYGLEPILTDGMSSLIISNDIVPHFKQQDYPGGIEAGVDAIAKLLTLPPEEAQKIAAEADQQQNEGGGISLGTVVFILIILFFVVIPMINEARSGGRRKRSGGGFIWIPGGGHDDDHWGGGSGWGGGGFGGGGFSGGGGSFGGGGSSGSW